MTIELEGFTRTPFTCNGETRDVYRRGEGPAVVIATEVPGLTPPVIRFAERVASEGFTVFMPQLFGTPGAPLRFSTAIGILGKACISREFSVLAANESSPIVDWLRGLCRHAHEAVGGKGVGAIGMCLTGNFALTLMVDPYVVAPILCQPSLPFVIGKKRKAALHISDANLAIVKERCAQGAKVLGLRFTHDFMCPPERFESLRKALGDGFEGIEIDSGPGNAWGIKRSAHSPVTNDLIDESGHPTQKALERVLAFLREKLRD
ncbi:MAG TPA: dienelactone hydrolase family protein [Polyangium sp.]|nr:dienelactone hydrolase family protein [Polyangium sp.]